MNTAGFYECKWCNKKYKRDIKLHHHIQTIHPFARLHSNKSHLLEEDRTYMLRQLYHYSQLIQNAVAFSKAELSDAIIRYLNWNGKTPIDQLVVFVWASHMLLPIEYKDYTKNIMRPEELGLVETTTNYVTIEKINEDDSLLKNVTRITMNHLEFCRRVHDSGLLKKATSYTIQLKIIFEEFGRFLNLGQPWNGDGNFCPSLTIDLIWHSAMMNNTKYMELSRRFMGIVLPHCLEENEDKHSERYSDFFFASFKGNKCYSNNVFRVLLVVSVK